MKSDGKRRLDAGMDEYISKPVRAVDLLPLVGENSRRPAVKLSAETPAA